MSESAPPEGFVEFGLARSRASKRRRPRQHKVFDDLPLSARRNRAVALGWDIAVPEPERTFFYLPFEHSEELSDQEWSVELYSARMVEDADYLLHAKAHREIIARFGRFPFRNAALGRETTAEEQAFLDAGAYPAVISRLKAEQEESHAPDA